MQHRLEAAAGAITIKLPQRSSSNADAWLLVVWRAGVREGAGAPSALPQLAYRARPALACIIGAPRA